MTKKYVVAAMEIQQNGKTFKKGEFFKGEITDQLLEGFSIVEFADPSKPAPKAEIKEVGQSDDEDLSDLMGDDE